MTRYRTKTLHDLFKNLDSAERLLRNRRLFEEADAVKFARDVLLEEAADTYRESEKAGKTEDEISPGCEKG